MKILMTGSEGMLGADIIDIIRNGNIVIPVDKKELDITDKDKLKKSFDEIAPDVVLHLAALTDLDFCEKNPREAFKVNAEATGNIAELCRQNNAKMIYISTSGVFPGDRDEPYTEDDKPNPVSVYGRSKFEGENYVRRFLPDNSWLILRAGWLFGGGSRDKKFVGKMFNLMSRLDEVKVVDDIYGSPVYSRDFGTTVKFLIDKMAYGLYHVVNSGIVSRYEIACEIEQIAALGTKINRATADDFPTVAPRPPMEGIITKSLKDVYGYDMRPWRESLRDYIMRLKDEV